MTTSRKPYPSDVSDEEWALAAPYLTLLPEDAGQRTPRLGEVFDGLRYLVRYGVPWRALPNDLPPSHGVYDQAQRWLRAGCFEMLTHDLRAVLRLAAGRKEEPSAAVLDSRTLRSTPESGGGARRGGGQRPPRAQGPPPPRRPPRTASPWRWSSRPRRSGASSCCPAGGWSSGPSPGWPAAAGWPATTSACPRRWQASTSSPSPASCSGAPETWPWSLTGSSAGSGGLLCEGLDERAAVVIAQPLPKFLAGELAVGLGHGPLAVHPLGLDRVEPRAPARQTSRRQPLPAALTRRLWG